MRRLLQASRTAAGSNAVKLTSGILLLSLCVLLLADLVGLRDQETETRQDAREAIVETLAVQLTTLAGQASSEAVAVTAERIVRGKQEIVAAELVDTEGVRLAVLGDEPASWRTGLDPAVAHVAVPIIRDGRPWGALKVRFRDATTSRLDLAYFVFVALGLLVTHLAYLSRVLLQLDPSKAVPQRVENAFNLLSEGVVVLDEKLRVLMANESAVSMVGKPLTDLVGRDIDRWPWVVDVDWQAPWLTTLETGMTLSDQLVHLHPDVRRSYSMKCHAIRGDSGAITGIMLTLSDVTEIEEKNRELFGTLKQLRRSQASINRKNRELEELASRDPLTGINNRRAIVVELRKEIGRAATTGSPVVCLMIDIDHFKRINDTLGHAAGDEVICALASLLVASVRTGDAVGRIGGEEFVVLLPNTDIDVAETIAESIRANTELLAEDVTIPVDQLSVSIGIASSDQEVETYEQLLDRADQALYFSKRNGRNRSSVFDPIAMAGYAEAAETPVPAPEGGTPELSRELQLVRQLDQQSKDLERLRHFDATTGLPKRDLFRTGADAALKKAKSDGVSLAVLSIALRDLERLQSMLGHAATETLVRNFAQRIRDGLQRVDGVTEIGDGHGLSHLRSEEFGVLLGELRDGDQAMNVVTRIRRLLSTPILVAGRRVQTGATIGIAIYPDDGDSTEALMERAASARAEAVQEPDKTAFRFASENVVDRSRDALEMEADLFLAIEKDQFSVHYQPKFDLAEQRIGGVEALVRWQHPTRGWVSPADFIPVCEANGLIKEITAFVMATSLRQVKKWQHLGLDDLTVSVNISATLLGDPDLVSDVLSAAAAAGVAPDRLDVELTETSVIGSPRRARIALGQLRSAGISVSMDDFGTGYTSIGLLADLPLDSVKIDRSFIDGMSRSDRSRAIVESVIGMAHTLGLSVVGEGVETNEQLTTLADLGCDEIQGYLISKPLAADGMTRFLDDHRRRFPQRRRA